ncbi:MAG: inositol monophosphatase, partial [Odoribacter sp.]|nr:inositol monophosphatase [Odoribacter sp.]
MNQELNLEQVLPLVTEWAKEVGKLHLAYFRGNNLDIRTKSNVYDVVTRADKEAEAFLIREIGKNFTDHALWC